MREDAELLATTPATRPLCAWCLHRYELHVDEAECLACPCEAWRP